MKTSLISLFLLFPGIAAAAPPAPIPGAQKVFREVYDLVSKEYVDKDLSDDAIWTGAIQGTLDRLVQADGQKINTLLSPAELEELQTGISGAVSGVGIIIHEVEGMVFIREVLPRGPAAGAGLLAGDRIVSIGGRSVRGLSQPEVLSAIRGPSGTTVDLVVQRDTDERKVPLTRQTIEVDSAFGAMVGRVAYVRISAFTKRTAASLDVALASLAAAKPTGLVVDLRECPGGLFDVALEVSDRFLKKGERILSLKKRDGKEEVHVASGKLSLGEVPVVVIFDRHTASSAEILAAALIDNRGARTVGEQTFGKGTVEKVMELDNGWALKLSVARFYSPKGKSWQGVGIVPDFRIPSSEETQKRPYTAQAAPKPELDPQLRAAISLLASR